MSNMNPEAPEFSSKRTQKLQSQQPQPQQQLPPPPQPSYIPHHHHIHHHHVLHHHVHHHHHHAVPPFQQQQAPSSAPPPAPPSLLQVSKLRPTASEFQPMKNKSSPLSSSTAGAAPPLASPITPTAGNAGLPPPPPPASPPQYNPASSPTKQSVGPMPADVVKSNLNRLATPFTPTKARTSPTNSGAPTFPASPAPTTTATTSTGTVRLPPPPIAPTTPPSAVEVAPTAAPEPTAAEAGSSSSSAAPSSPKVEEPLPFAGSQLPVPEKPNEAPAEPIKFNTTWTLHADDHPATFGSQTYAPPVQVRDVSDLQTFWRLWRYCTPPSRCVPSFTYIWFRRDVKPQWEDPKNKNGGSISIALYDRDRIGSGQTKESMDDAFLLALMSLAGESLPESTIVNGIFLKVRPNRPVVLQYWTNISTEAKLRTLAQGIRSVLGRALPAKALEKLEYFSHSQLQQAQAPAAAAQAGKGKQAGRPQRPKAMEPDFTF